MQAPNMHMAANVIIMYQWIHGLEIIGVAGIEKFNGSNIFQRICVEIRF